MSGCFLSPAETWFKHTSASHAVVITTGQIYFQPLFHLSPPLPAPIFILIPLRFSIRDSSLHSFKPHYPFATTTGPNCYSINVTSVAYISVVIAKRELRPADMSDPLCIAACAAGPFIRTLHSPWTQLHHMPSANPILLISHPIPGSFSKQKKKGESRFELCFPTPSSETDSSVFLLVWTVIISNWRGSSSLVTAGLLQYKKWSRGFNYHYEFIYDGN